MDCDHRFHISIEKGLNTGAKNSVPISLIERDTFNIRKITVSSINNIIAPFFIGNFHSSLYLSIMRIPNMGMIKFGWFPTVFNFEYMFSKRFVHFWRTFNFYKTISTNNISIDIRSNTRFPFRNNKTYFSDNNISSFRIPISRFRFGIRFIMFIKIKI